MEDLSSSFRHLSLPPIFSHTAIILCFTVQAATLSFHYGWLVLGPPANHTGSPLDEAHIHKRYTPGRNTSHLIASE